jgi:hypothetical protein
MNSRSLLERFDLFLEDRGVGFEAIVVGGAALNLLGVISRATKDCDVLDPEIPPAVATVARAFAAEVRKSGETLQDDWLNNGPRSLAVDLPPEWREQIRPVFVGKKLRLQTLGRKDLLRVKLFALCDRGIDLGDCLALAPTEEELALVRPWIYRRDAHPDWPKHVHSTLASLGEKLGHRV